MSRASNQQAEAKTAMLIRRPVTDIFSAIVEPEQITRFWFSHASAPLTPSAIVEWTWAPYNASATVKVLEFEVNRRILTEWPNASGPTRVEYLFHAQPDGTTFVEITESGFHSSGMDLVREVADSTQGFTLVLAGLKAWCEHALQLNLVWDRFPSNVVRN
ncbi:MAG: SRPBCC family protein [Gemmatimonadaceae bacterium]|nr:SRPBCC family protein [Gemmatimonadaceae bacterium]